MVELGSPVAAYVAARCEVRPDAETTRDALYADYRGWCGTERRPLDRATFGRDLAAVCPSVRDVWRGPRGEQQRCYASIGLRPRVSGQ